MTGLQDISPFTQIQGDKLATKLCVQLVTILKEEKVNLSGTFNNHLSNQWHRLVPDKSVDTKHCQLQCIN